MDPLLLRRLLTGRTWPPAGQSPAPAAIVCISIQASNAY